MRPDASWPQPVQDAFDRVLQRKAEDRYQRSSQFATALSAAVRGMQSANAGVGAGATAALAQPLGGTVPPTRVRDGAGGGAAPARKKSALVPVGAGAGVLVAAAAVWFFLGAHRATPAGAADSTRATVQQTPLRDTQSTAQQTPPRDTQPLSHAVSQKSSTDSSPQRTAFVPPAPSAPVTHTGNSGAPAGTKSSHTTGGEATGVSAAAAATARAQVESAANLIASENPDAGRAIRMLNGALGQLPTRDDSVTAEYHLSEALFTQAEQQSDDALRRKGCDMLRPLLGATGNKFHDSIRFLYGDRKCQ